MTDPAAPRLTLTLPPERWQVVEPTPGTSFQAQRKGEFEFFRPTISVSLSPLLPEEMITDVASALLADVRRLAPDARVDTDTSALERGRVLQRVVFALHAEGLPPLELAQWQVVVAMPTTDGSEQAFAMSLVLSAERSTIHEYAADFQAFVGSATVTDEPTA